MVRNERCPTGNFRKAKMLKHVISGEIWGSTVFFAWKKTSRGMVFSHAKKVKIVWHQNLKAWTIILHHFKLLGHSLVQSVFFGVLKKIGWVSFFQEHWSWWKWKMTSLHHIFTIHLYFTQCLNARKPMFAQDVSRLTGLRWRERRWGSHGITAIGMAMAYDGQLLSIGTSPDLTQDASGKWSLLKM